MKKILKITIIVLSFLLIGFIIWATCFNPKRGITKNFNLSEHLSTELTTKEALQDFDFAFNKLKSRHPLWLEKTENAEKLKNLITSEYQKKRDLLRLQKKVSVTVLYQYVAEMLALLKDGHTNCSVIANDLTSIEDFTPFAVYGNPIAINGINVLDLYQVFKTRFSHEVDIAIKNRFFSSYVFRTDYLALVGIDITKPATYTYKTKNGTIDYVQNFIPHAESFYPTIEDIKIFLEKNNFSQEEISKILSTSTTENFSQNQVEGVKVVGDPNSWIWYTIDKTKDIAIFSFNQCNYNKEYKTTLKNFFKDVKEANINNVAVDLRNNGGGNSSVANEFIKHLNVDKYKTWDCAVRYGPILTYFNNDYIKNNKYDTNFDGDVFILTNNQTYSAAMDFAMLIQDNNLGKIIGEPSSNKPESYGDCLYFQLPNSKLHLSISFKKWYRIDQSKKDLLIEPDIPCDEQKAVSVLYDLI